MPVVGYESGNSKYRKHISATIVALSNHCHQPLDNNVIIDHGAGHFKLWKSDSYKLQKIRFIMLRITNHG